MQIREMEIKDYGEVFALWQITTRRALSESDGKEEIARFLERNKGLSQVAVVDGKIVGTILAGHDGRRGFIYHMAVLPEQRRRGIGEKLAETAIAGLKAEGITKTRIFVFKDNFTGQSFWKSLGFEQREDIFNFSYD